MFKRFWQSLNDWAEALSMDDPRGGYMFSWKIASQDSSAKSKVFRSSSERRRPDRRMTVSISCEVTFNSERAYFAKATVAIIHLFTTTCRARRSCGDPRST
jgi:hypothetical protein